MKVSFELVAGEQVPLAQRIARWTSNPKVLGSIPRWDEKLLEHAHTSHRLLSVNRIPSMSGWPSGLRRQTQGSIFAPW